MRSNVAVQNQKLVQANQINHQQIHQQNRHGKNPFQCLVTPGSLRAISLIKTKEKTLAK